MKLYFKAFIIGLSVTTLTTLVTYANATTNKYISVGRNSTSTSLIAQYSGLEQSTGREYQPRQNINTREGVSRPKTFYHRSNEAIYKTPSSTRDRDKVVASACFSLNLSQDLTFNSLNKSII